MQDRYIGWKVADQFRIVERVGKGGMATVYRAEQEEMNRSVAIKILQARYMEREDLVARFRREARAMSHLTHPSALRVFMHGVLEDGACFYVMEFVEGKNVKQVLRDRGCFETRQAIRILIQVCGALAEAHQLGIVHRDLKPENILLTEQAGIADFPKVLDFGLAKVTERQMRPGSQIWTQRGMMFGTPEFMSPEQVVGATDVDARADLYALGVICYEMLTGKLPYDASGLHEYIHQHVHGVPVALTDRAPGRKFPDGLQEVLWRALEKRPEDRFQSAVEFAKALEACVQGPLFSPNSMLPAPPARKGPSPWLLGIALFVFGALVAGGAVAAFFALQ